MNETWIRIGIEGVYGGVRFDRALFEKVVENFEHDVPFERREGGFPLGWVSKVEVRDALGCFELWGLTKWVQSVEWIEGAAAVLMESRKPSGEERGPALMSVFPKTVPS